MCSIGSLYGPAAAGCPLQKSAGLSAYRSQGRENAGYVHSTIWKRKENIKQDRYYGTSTNRGKLEERIG